MTSPSIPHEGDDPLASDPEEDDATRDLRRRERLEQNRISARESRKRKKNMIEELQRTVITLSRENKELNERNEALRRELVEIGTKNPGVVNIQALMSCSGGGTAAAEGGGGATNAVASAGGEAADLDKSPAMVNGDVENEPPSVTAVATPNEPANPQAASQNNPQQQVVVQQQEQQPAVPQQMTHLQQQQSVASFNPQQLAMMQQMMALQQVQGMIPGAMMGIPPGAAMMGAMPGIPGQQQQQPPTQQGGQQPPPAAEEPK